MARGLSETELLAFQMSTTPKVKGVYDHKQGKETCGVGEHLTVPSWNCHKVPHRSVALTGGTSRAAVSLHTVAAGGQLMLQMPG